LPWRRTTESPPGSGSAGYRPGRPPATARVATAVRRSWRQGPTCLRMGVDRHHRLRRRRGHRMPLAADPPQQQHPGTGLLQGVLPAPGPAGEPGGRSRASLESRGRPADRQGTRSARRTPRPTLDVLASLGHPRPARTRLPVRHDRHSTGEPGHRRRADPLTRNEIRRLFTSLHAPQPAIRLRLQWSRWRLRHTNPEPPPATTADLPPQSHDHETSLEY